jgi:hypothetical protein
MNVHLPKFPLLRASAVATFALALVSLAGCPKKDEPKTTTTGEGEGKGEGKKTKKDKDEKGDDEGDEKAAGEEKKPKGKAGSGCKLPEGSDLVIDFTITKGCKVTIQDSIAVREGATLTIEPGARIAFKTNVYLNIAEGKLLAQGSADAPILFTSADDSPNPGDWVGITFEENAKKGSIIDRAKIEYAGKTGNIGEGAITLRSDVGPDRITVTNTIFQNNDTRGVKVQSDKSRFAKFEGNSFVSNDKVSLEVPPEVVSSIGANKLGGENIHVTDGQLTHEAKWPKIDAAYVIDGNLVINGEKEAPVLTLPDDATLKFAANTYLQVGAGQGGGLVATNVTFTSAAVTPDKDDWVGIVFEEKVTKTKLDGCTIEYAGKTGNIGSSAISFRGDIDAKKAAKRVEITNVTMRKCETPGFSFPDGACGDFADKAKGNKVDSGDLCKKG